MSEEEAADLEARREKRKEAWAAAKIPYGASDAELDAMAGSIHQIVLAVDPSIRRADVVRVAVLTVRIPHIVNQSGARGLADFPPLACCLGSSLLADPPHFRTFSARRVEIQDRGQSCRIQSLGFRV